MRFLYRPCVAALCLAVLAAAGNTFAQNYPAKPVRMIVPFPPGGSNDILGRTLALKLAETLKQQVIVENRGGAGGSIGAEAAAKSPADGYTILIGHVGTLAVNAGLYPKLGYDPVRSFAPITLIANVPNVLVVHPSVPANTAAELVAHARANPGKLYYSSAGNGSAAHVTMEYFKLQTQADIVHVPYKGTGPSVTDLIAGQVSMTITGIPPVISHIRAGKLRALGVSSLQRVDALPQTPTISESGVKGFDAVQWYGIVAPAGTPRAIVMKLNADIRGIMQSPQMRERLNTEGAIATTSTPEEFAAHIRSEIARWGAVIKRAGIQAE
ncbi:MAG: tripartite tricarboxylate transporter substrate binding protein [Betaproteobacteria bacterium]|nr:MAG: tripartite tricarboxylate transporter substrate binding protein [Betaproteobacteria bacterium]